MPPDRIQGLFAKLLQHPPVAVLRQVTAGAPCHLVGGILRDRLLGLETQDVDAVVAGRGHDIARRLADRLPARLVYLGGKAFAAFRLVGDGFHLDLWDRQQSSLESDLLRRDFTVNSFALEVHGGHLVDPVAGLDDLDRRVLRATTPESFGGDPLRILRLPRLLLQLPGFSADPVSLQSAAGAAEDLTRVAAERVREELRLIFSHPEGHTALTLLHALHLYPGLFLGTPGRPGPLGGASSTLAALGPVTHRLDAATELPPVDRLTAALGVVFANLPIRDPLSALSRFRGAGYLSRREGHRIGRLLEIEDLPRSEPEQRRFVHRLGALYATAFAFLGAQAAAAGGTAAWETALGGLQELVRGEGAALLEPPRLVTGHDVQQLLGLEPGPQVGELLRAVRQAQIEGRVRSRQQALEMLQSHRPQATADGLPGVKTPG